MAKVISIGMRGKIVERYSYIPARVVGVTPVPTVVVPDVDFLEGAVRLTSPVVPIADSAIQPSKQLEAIIIKIEDLPLLAPLPEGLRPIKLDRHLAKYTLLNRLDCPRSF